MTDAPARRTPNTAMTEADWQAAMAMFLEGATDAEIARHFGVSNSTVAAQRFKRGVYRENRPVALRRPGPRPARPTQLGAEDPAGPALVLPEGDDPQATASALLAYSRSLAAAQRMAEAANAARLARAFLLTARLSASSVGDAAEAQDDRPDPPVLRAAQRPPDGDWRTWLFLGGRGAGKTLAGAAWLARQARKVERLALLGPSVLDVREVMI